MHCDADSRHCTGGQPVLKGEKPAMKKHGTRNVIRLLHGKSIVHSIFLLYIYHKRHANKFEVHEALVSVSKYIAKCASRNSWR